MKEKYLVIYHNGNGGIDKKGVTIEEAEEVDMENLEDIQEEEYFVCRIPLKWIKDLVNIQII